MTEKIMKYLSGEMSEEEKKNFEKQLQTNEKLKTELNLHKKLDDFLVEINEIEDLKDIVKDTHNEYLKENKTKNTKVKWYSSIAAALLILLGSFWLFNNIKNSASFIYKQNYMAWSINDNYRGANEYVAYKEWHENYKAGEYNKLTIAYDSLPNELKSNASVNLMYACALLEQNNYSKALDILNVVLEDNVFMQDNYIWYKALCLLKLKEIEKAKLEFNKLLNSDSYNERVIDILQRLDN